MLITITLMLIIMFFLITEKKIPLVLITISISLPLIFLMIWYIEYTSGRIDFFISDELHYYNVGNLGLPEFSDRYLYYLLNYLVIHHDLSLGGISLKIINIPFYFGLLILLYKIFNRNKYVFLLPIILPYLPHTSIFNLRDILILFITVWAIYLYFEKKKILLSLFLIVFLYLLRPFAAMLLILIITIPFIHEFIVNVMRGKLHKKTFLFISIMLVSVLVFIDPISDRVSSYQRWFEYTTGEGELTHIESVSDVSTGNRYTDFLISLIRYALTPFPHSLAIRILDGGSNQWGLIDDIIRLLNQVGYLFLLTYILLNLRYLQKIIKKINLSQGVLITSFLIYWPIYSFHLYGATHQRLKIPFQIVIFLVVLLITEYKKEKTGPCNKNI